MGGNKWQFFQLLSEQFLGFFKRFSLSGPLSPDVLGGLSWLLGWDVLVSLIWSNGGEEGKAGRVGVSARKSLLFKFKQQSDLEEMAPRLGLPGVH
jgi:hypothetical protein